MANEQPHTGEPRPPVPGNKLDKPDLEADLEPKPRYQAPSYKPADKLANKKALITGGDSGIGRAVASAELPCPSSAVT